ncbi:hypothetical protein C1646_768266 [Rhizophagus diaphanus]|nr:hypothetical protein C1646_768266 [Rhizophagus diaphanus] [Rhizophagus sp. MUCL 43196]
MSIDSYIHPNKLFQITIADKHGVKQEKLKEYYRDILDQSGEIRLYFVVPEESFRTYKKQNYLDGSKKAECFSMDSKHKAVPDVWIMETKRTGEFSPASTLASDIRYMNELEVWDYPWIIGYLNIDQYRFSSLNNNCAFVN